MTQAIRERLRPEDHDFTLHHGEVTVPRLAARELEVLRLLAEGMRTGEIAGRLAYSERTIKLIVHHAVLTLGVRNRTHAVAYAIRHGLV